MYRKRQLLHRRIETGAIALVAGLGIIAGAAPASATTAFDESVTSWTSAASRLGQSEGLWTPGRTLGLERRGTIRVLADNLSFSTTTNAVATGDTFAGGSYGTARRGFTLSEKWAGTGWSAEPAFTTSMALVGRVVVRLGPPGTQVRVRATVYANCFPQPANADPRAVPAGYRCTPADVQRTGGVLTMRAVAPNTMVGPASDDIVIQSSGLSYAQLLSVATGLEQASGQGDDSAGSAQMLAMCGQMTDRRMSFAQAKAFAEVHDYLARVGSIDGVPQAVTADYRPTRFTVSTVGGAVTACTYG